MVRNCRLKVECWISGHRETAERIITMKLGYLEFVEVLSKQLLNALNLQEQQIFFKKKAIDNKDRLFVETFENLSGKQLCGIDVKDLSVLWKEVQWNQFFILYRRKLRN